MWIREDGCQRTPGPCWQFSDVVTTLLNSDQAQWQSPRQFNAIREFYHCFKPDIHRHRFVKTLSKLLYFLFYQLSFLKLAKLSYSLPSKVLKHRFWEGRGTRGSPGTKDSTWMQYRVLGSSQVNSSVLLVMYHWGREVQMEIRAKDSRTSPGQLKEEGKGQDITRSFLSL